jgi:predicted house-cleaning noncanonical NTP pyrophosphatase (MazG superfamily)
MSQQDFIFTLPGQLVRDYVPELARRSAAGLVFDQAPSHQLEPLMARKIAEEAEEVITAQTPQESADRLAAVYELLEGLARRRQLSMTDLACRARELDVRKGPFQLGLVLVGKALNGGARS